MIGQQIARAGFAQGVYSLAFIVYGGNRLVFSGWLLASVVQINLVVRAKSG